MSSSLSISGPSSVASLADGVVLPFLLSKSKPLIVILGPTAGGKTALSIDLALELQRHGKTVEIINADSRQVYTQLDIGTAKIRPQEMQGIPHHLINQLDPSDELTIAWYKEKAMNVIDALHDRKNIPMLVGGSMLYISSVIDGLKPLPPVDDEILKKLEEEYDRDEGVTLHKKLLLIDPASAANIPVQNRVYLIRAMAIYESTGELPSKIKQVEPCPYDLLILGIAPPRDILKKRIEQRVKQMLENGWIEEVRSLLEKGYSEHDPGMKSHGYREIIGHLRGNVSMEELSTIIISKTNQYAKRQMTWWRGDERIRWVG